MLIVPSYADIDREMMDTMIQEVNETQVSKEERTFRPCILLFV